MNLVISNNILSSEQILRTIGGVYNNIHLFDLEKDAVQEIYAIEAVHNFLKEYGNKKSIQELLHHVANKVSTDEYLSSILEFTNLSTLEQRIKGKKIISFDYVEKYAGWTRCSFIPVEYSPDKKLRYVLYTSRVIQDDKNHEENLLAQMDYDEHTGLYNRRALERDGKHFGKEGMPKDLTLIAMDINGLNAVNHTLGVEAGDELVKGAADCIIKVFGSKGKIYRLGGDEFYVIIDMELNELVKLFSVFDNVTASWKGNLAKGLTISKGIAAHAEFPDLTFRELLAKADQRMYQEKEQYYKSRDKRIGENLKEPESFSLIMQKAYSGFVSLQFGDGQLPKLFVDDFIANFLGFELTNTPEKNYEEWINRIHPDYSDFISSAIEKIIIGNQTEVQYPWFHPKAGLTYIRTFGYRDPNFTDGVRINGTFQNVTNLVHLQKDRLTGFYTNEAFFQKAEEILMANKEKNYRFFVSDIENFKAINDRYGNEHSDELLKYLAKSLKNLCKNLVLAGRLSTDVFVCMQEDTGKVQTSKEGLKFQNAILDGAPIKNFVWKHGVYYTRIDRNISAQQMCDRARLAVESIKGNYDVACALYDEKLDKFVKTKQQILENMEDALKNKEFKVYLQPKHDLRKNKTGGAEALVRWIHPVIGFMNPGDFIPVFEQNGFVKSVDEFVFREVCLMLRRWIDEGKPVVPISVNLSRRDFDSVDLAEQLLAVIEEIDIPHELIHFEVTESAFSDSPDRIANTIRKLHDEGFVIELDDFGTGYSSLTSLSEIEFDILKLDMSIIRNDNPDSPRNVLDMCNQIVKQMNLKSVAEGVETEAQLNRLKNIGCDYIQGYYFSKPLPVEDFENYLANEA